MCLHITFSIYIFLVALNHYPLWHYPLLKYFFVFCTCGIRFKVNTGNVIVILRKDWHPKYIKSSQLRIISWAKHGMMVMLQFVPAKWNAKVTQWSGNRLQCLPRQNWRGDMKAWVWRPILELWRASTCSDICVNWAHHVLSSFQNIIKCFTYVHYFIVHCRISIVSRGAA